MSDIVLSIVITVYNTEKYLDRCLKSLLNQTYSNLQIIVVNDGSPGNIEEMIHKYEDLRIRYVTYEKNRGLFCARLAGAEIATGEYIAFVDSDDYVTEDNYRLLINQAVKTDADIVIGKTIFEHSNGEQYIRPLHDDFFLFDVLRGEAVRNAYFSQKGICFSWHTVWNKIYKKSLWDQCLPYYKRINKHLIMTEDIAFSSVLFYFAQAASSVQNGGYFYCQNEGASTDTSRTVIRHFRKNMSDIRVVFEFVEVFLAEQHASEQIKNNFLEFKKYYSRMWRELGDFAFSGKDRKDANKIMDEFLPGYNEYTKKDCHFMSTLEIKWNGTFEFIKKQISSSQYSCISFDIFDTLIIRPFYQPSDLFLLMEKNFERIYPSNISFLKIRTIGEMETRRRIAGKYPSYQDVTIDEIYETISDLFQLPDSITMEMKEEEKQLEIQFCQQRRSAKELYDLARLTGKKVVITSDMYLDRETIQKILSKNGYEGYDNLYLSSEYRLTKDNGALYKAVLKNLEIPKGSLLHVGDNWHSDNQNPKKLGIETVFFPKAVESFEGKIASVMTTRCAGLGEQICGSIQSSTSLKESFGYRTMLAIAANYYFDNPYRSFREDTDFSCDPYFLGRYVLGMHMVGLAKWIMEKGTSLKYSSISFMSRDGYLPLKIYQKICAYYPEAPIGKYLYTSRKAVLPAMIKTKADFYDLPIEFHNHSPRTLLSLLQFCSDVPDIQLLKQNGILFDKSFDTSEEYRQFIRYFVGHLYNEEKHHKAFSLASDYYSRNLDKRAATFDLGYSGRIQSAVSQLAGRGVNVLFVHSDSKRAANCSRKEEFRIDAFYDFTPCMSGLIREHIFSDPAPSCIGFHEENDKVLPQIEEDEKTFQDLFIVRLLHQGALDFADEFLRYFGNYLDYLDFKPQEVSLPFEAYLRTAKDPDQRIFAASYFEDMVYGATTKLNIYEFMHSQILAAGCGNESMPGCTMNYASMVQQIVWGKGKSTKFLMYLLFDRKLLKEKVKLKLQDRPGWLMIFRRGYRLLKKVSGRR